MNILVFNQQKDLSFSKSSVQNVVKEVLTTEQVHTDEVAIYFVTRPEICRLHEELFRDPTPTDCISIPLDTPTSDNTGYHILGEIFICPLAAIDYAPTNPLPETTLYLVHGLLHLLGHDDLNAPDRRKMRTAERKHMSHLLSLNLLLQK